MNGNKPPRYPLQARKEGREGEVDLLYRVTKEGGVADIQIVRSSGSQDLDQEAVRAIAKFRFVPGQEGWARHPVNFTLKGETAALPSRLRTKVGGAQSNE
jgi:protein TonB